MGFLSRWLNNLLGIGDARRRPWSRSRQLPTVFAFLLPGIFLFLVFNIYPLLKALQISFYDWSIVPNTPSEFVGPANYAQALADPIARLASSAGIGSIAQQHHTRKGFAPHALLFTRHHLLGDRFPVI